MKNYYVSLALVVAGIAIGPASINAESYACPQDAKVCPDGSTVGRTGPNCEFAVCPGTIGESTAEPESEAKPSVFKKVFNFLFGWLF